MTEPEQRLFPEGIGELLHKILNPELNSGPLYTHTFRLPPDEYDDDGNVLPKRVQPSFTLYAGAGVGAYAARAAAEHEQRYLALRDEGLDNDAARIALANFTAYAQTTPWSYETAWREWQTLRARKALAAMAPFTRARPSFFGHRADAAMARAFASWPTAPCSCHPAPFPAARDYRRRTKHHNRRS